MAQWFENAVNSIVKAVVGAAQVSGVSKTSEPVNMELALEPGQAVTVDTPSGSLEAMTATNNVGSIAYTKTCWGLSEEDAKKAFEGVRLVVRKTNEGTLIHPEYDKSVANTNRVSVNIAITVPKGHHVTARTASGSVGVKGFTEGVHAHSASGSVRIEDCHGKVEGGSSSGSVTGTRCSGNLRLSSQSGSVSASNCDGEVNLSSVSGSVSMNSGTGNFNLNAVSGSIQSSDITVKERLFAKAVSGFVKVNCKPAPGAQLEARSVSGFVDVTLSPGISIKFDCHSLSGGVDVTLPCSFTLKDARKAVGTCGPQTSTPVVLTAETTSGRVHVGA